MDMERMKRVLGRVYGKETENAPSRTEDALRELLRLEEAGAAQLRMLTRHSRACMDALGAALRRGDARRKTLQAEFFLREGERAPAYRTAPAQGVLSALRQVVLLCRERARLYESAAENGQPLPASAARQFAGECRAEEAAARRLLALSQR